MSAWEISHCSHPSGPMKASQSGYQMMAWSRRKLAMVSRKIPRGAWEQGSSKNEMTLVLNLDSVPPPHVLEEIQKDPDISNVKVVIL